MSDELSHPWGIPIEAYIQTLDKPRLNKRVPSRTEVISALQKVYNQSLSVSCTTFEDILAVVLYPDEMAEIAQRSNALSSSCVKLLRDHSTQAGGLLNYQYGYLGLRVLVLSLLITFVGYTSLGETAQLDYEQENTDRIMQQLAAKASSRLTFGLSLHAAPPEDIWHRSSDPRSLSSLMDWNGNMTNIELDDLFGLLAAERSSFFNLCHLLQDTRGWALLLFVLWIRVAPWCGPGNKIAIAPLKRLYQLNDLLGRYCLAATHDPTLTIAYPLARWMSYKLLPLVGTPSFCPSPADLAELPRMRRIAFTQLKATEAFEGDPPGVDRLSVSLGFITGYQTYSGLLDDLDLQLTDVAFARLWAAVQSDQTFAGDGMVGRYDICKLAYAVLRNVSFTMLCMGPVAFQNLGASELVGLRCMAVRYSAVIQQAGLVDLMGRIILMPLLQSEFRQDSERCLRALGMSWFHMLGYIDCVPGLLKEFHKDAVNCFDDDYATWLKVLYFLRFQDFLVPSCEEYIGQCGTRWLGFGRDLGFLAKLNQRCAYTGCIGSVPLRPEVLLCCSECSSTYYCGRQCQARAWEIRDTDSHRISCTWDWSEAQHIQESASQDRSRTRIEDLEGWHVGMMGGSYQAGL